MVNGKVKHTLYWLLLSAIIVGLDQFTKALVKRYVMLHSRVRLLPFLDLTLVYNQGAAFSFLHNAGGWQRYLFIGIALCVSTILTIWLYRLPSEHRLLALSIALIIGGAIGNFVDRVLAGQVVDFIVLYYANWHWPAFNVADSAISVGVVLMVWDSAISKN
ncbi:hypothetical protein TI04_05455 [Achromatium sp. WMS2]|nr:hypothetical protein TI04_05455 [Achromatium sp. WMS2]